MRCRVYLTGMSKKHFEAAAAKIRGMMEESQVTLDNQLRQRALAAAEVFASVASEFNPRFDRARFFTACGIVL